MAMCLRHGYFAEPTDEQGMHACPSCVESWEEEDAVRDEIRELQTDIWVSRGKIRAISHSKNPASVKLSLIEAEVDRIIEKCNEIARIREAVR